jgi:hypothetical protein
VAPEKEEMILKNSLCAGRGVTSRSSRLATRVAWKVGEVRAKTAASGKQKDLKGALISGNRRPKDRARKRAFGIRSSSLGFVVASPSMGIPRMARCARRPFTLSSCHESSD